MRNLVVVQVERMDKGVAVGAVNLDEFFRFIRERAQAAGIVERHQFVVGAVDNQERDVNVPYFGQGIEFIA